MDAARANTTSSESTCLLETDTYLEHGAEQEQHVRSNTPSIIQSKINTNALTKRERIRSHFQKVRHAVASTKGLLHSISEREKRRHGRYASHTGAAAFLVRDAVLGDDVEQPAEGAFDPYATELFNNNKNTDSEWWTLLRVTWAFLCRKWCPVAEKLFWMSALMLMALTFCEPPHWCRNDYSLPYAGCEKYLWARGIPAGSDNSTINMVTTNTELLVDYYPSTNSTLLTVHQTHALEAMGVSVIAVILLLRLGRDGMSLPIYLRPSRVRVSRILQLICLVLLSAGLILEHQQSSGKAETYTKYHTYIRLILLGTLLRGSQREMDVLMDLLPKVLNILLLLLVVMIFYAWFGVVMFVDTKEGNDMFPSLLEALWTLWICVTTANYPDVMMPGYNINRWTAIYFVSFMIITFFFLTNIVLAAVVNEYDTNVQERRNRNTDYTLKCLKKAYHLLTQEEEDLRVKKGIKDSVRTSERRKERIDKKTVMELFDILNNDFPEFDYLAENEQKLIFAVLDRDGSSMISEEEFLDFGSVLTLEFVNTDVYKTLIERYFPLFYESNNWQSFCRLIKSPQFEHGIDIVLVLNMIVVGIQSWPELSSVEKVHIDEKYWDGSIDTVWELAEAIFTVFYVCEALIKIAVFGWKRYSEQMRNMFDLLITIMAAVSTVVVYYPNDYSDSRLIRMVLTARVLRLLRLLTALSPFQLIGKVSAEILPSSASVLGLLFVLMYFFAALGLQLYGGLISRDPSNEVSYLLLGTDFSNSEYWANNFNDMLSGMNVLFNLLVVNNWFVCEVGFEATSQAKWVRLYFLSFHIIGVVLVNNLVIAFIISNFLTQLAVFQENVGPEVVDGQAVIQDRRAIFDAAQITGTNTTLTGQYIARIRHAHSGISESNHHHAQLRALFTQTSTLDADADADADMFSTQE